MQIIPNTAQIFPPGFLAVDNSGQDNGLEFQLVMILKKSIARFIKINYL